MLQNDDIRLRAVEPEDLDFIYHCENDTATWFDGAANNPFSHFAVRQFIANTASDIYKDGELRLIMERLHDHAPLGIIDLYNYEPRHNKAAVAIWTHPSYRRQGYAAQALDLLSEYTFSLLHAHQLYAYIRHDNAASIALFKHSGFSKTATLTQWMHVADGYCDVLLMQRFS